MTLEEYGNPEDIKISDLREGGQGIILDDAFREFERKELEKQNSGRSFGKCRHCEVCKYNGNCKDQGTGGDF